VRSFAESSFAELIADSSADSSFAGSSFAADSSFAGSSEPKSSASYGPFGSCGAFDSRGSWDWGPSMRGDLEF